MKRVLITGASGMLGATMVEKFKDSFNVFATGNSFFKRQHNQYMKFDLISNSYEELINWSNPEIIIHCGAITNANFCEKFPDLAYNINGNSLQKFIEQTKNSVKIIFISTDAVFPSSVNLATEKDLICPESVYGKSKELGEFFLKTSHNRDYLIIRTTIVGLNKNDNKSGFVEWIINSAKNNRDLGLFTDVLFTPISIWSLTKEIEYIIKSNNINSEILHIGGQLCTKYSFGEALLTALNIPKSKLIKSSILSFKDRAKRSTDQSLDSSFYKKKYLRSLPDLKETINIIKKHLNEYN